MSFDTRLKYLRVALNLFGFFLSGCSRPLDPWAVAIGLDLGRGSRAFALRSHDHRHVCSPGRVSSSGRQKTASI